VTVREVIKLIEADGWYLDRQRSSHRQFKHPTQAGPGDRGGAPAEGPGPEDAPEHPPAGGVGAMGYLIILEPTPTGFSAYSPDLEGCVAAGDDREETIALMREAIAFHLEGLAAAGEPVPAPSSESAYVEVTA
jgi:predicted RNase H-like HicB family nuclease